MDAKLRHLYREYGGHSLQFLINCGRAGGIPLASNIELSLLPEIAKYTTFDRVLVSNLLPEEISHVQQYMRSNASRLGELIAQYVVNTNSSWTLFGHSREAIINRFLTSSSLSRDRLEDLFYDEDSGIFMDDMIDAVLCNIGNVSLEGFDIESRILDAYEERLNTEVVRLVWGVQGSMLEAVIRITLHGLAGLPAVSFYITLTGNATTRFENVAQISCDMLESPWWGANMVLFAPGS